MPPHPRGVSRIRSRLVGQFHRRRLSPISSVAHHSRLQCRHFPSLTAVPTIPFLFIVFSDSTHTIYYSLLPPSRSLPCCISPDYRLSLTGLTHTAAQHELIQMTKLRLMPTEDSNCTQIPHTPISHIPPCSLGLFPLH
jgi:hypothetical protein